MSDISPPSSVVAVQRREEKPANDGQQQRHEPPPDKVAETYEETARGTGEKITILGIPAELMTPQVSATIGGLVSEVEHLKSKIRRYEATIKKSTDDGLEELLVGDRFVQVLEKALRNDVGPERTSHLVLIVVNTFEDIRKSSGLLAANSALADVVGEIQQSDLNVNLVGLVGGPTIAVLLTDAPPDAPISDENGIPVTVADRVRAVLEGKAYSVSGIDMKLSFTVASVRAETGQDALHAIGQADHILRG